MRITFTVEVESHEALTSILRTGASLRQLDYKVVDWRHGPQPAPVVSSYTTEDYRNAPSDIGPLAATWKDKPHRLVYDLCTRLEQSAPAV